MPMSIAEVMSVGDAMARSGFFADCRQANQAVVKILAGRELGFGPIASMTGVHIVEGRPTMGAHLLAALIRRSGRYDYTIQQLDSERCDLQFSRLADGQKSEAVGVVSVTMADLVANGTAIGRDGKVKANYRRSPDDMLFARAISKGYKRYCPDLTFGVTVYAEGEIDNDATLGSPAETVAPGGEIVQVQDTPPSPVAAAAGPPAIAPVPPVVDYCGSINDIQLGTLDELEYRLKPTKEQWLKVLAGFAREDNGQAVPVTDVRQLSAGQADDLIARMRKAADARKGAAAA